MAALTDFEQATQNFLGWVQQSDGHSCGPLSAAAGLLLLQGLRPTPEALGIRRNPSGSTLLLQCQGKALRQAISQLFVTVCLAEKQDTSELRARVIGIVPELHNFLRIA